MAARHPARAPPPSIESIPASDDRIRAHLAACRHHTSKHSIVQWECRLNCRLGSKIARHYLASFSRDQILAEVFPGHVNDDHRSLHSAVQRTVENLVIGD